ncbi:MAG TPA: 5-methyltetrahydropteroyltriglutamate--homocysteine S-methyltransferase [Gammaproteobacteria bacterium]
MSVRNRPPFRADHVGSLLRPPKLLEMRQRAAAGEVDANDLRALEDECIRGVVRLQESLGLQGITDGEYRRESFHGDFISQVEGVEFKQLFKPGGDGSEQHEAPFVAVVSERMRLPEGGIEVENFRFLNSVTTRTAKQTIPSPTMTHFRGGRDAIDKDAYPEMKDFFADLTRVYKEEIEGLANAGCRYLQMDDTNLAYLCDEKMRVAAEERGEDLGQLLHDYAGLINGCIADRPDDMAVCVHMCRGNARSRWFAEGSYDPIAEVIFGEMNVDGFFLEYDDDRSGDFSPLRFVPKGKAIVLGLVTTKRGDLEDADAIKRRIEQASEHIDLDQLCLSPQCGFASISEGNLLTEEEEKRKLAMVLEIAEDVWG